MKVPLCRPSIGEREERAVLDVLRSGQLVQGAQVQQFEAMLSARLGRREVVAVANGTAALHLSFMALDLGPGDEVVLPAFAYPAPVNVAVLLGATPVLVDVTEREAAMDSNAVHSAVNAQTRAVVPIHPFGIAARGIREAVGGRTDIVEDAACALGASGPDGACGSWSRAACFSFHPRKIITSAEGGAVVLDDEDLAARVRSLRNHGQRDAATPADRFVEVGYNLRMSDLHASLGCVQLERLDELRERRRAHFDRYTSGLAAIPGVQILQGLNDPDSAVQSMIVTVDADRDRVIEGLRQEDVESTIAGYAVHLLPFYRARWADRSFPIAEMLHRQGLTLPLYPDMLPEQVDHVVEALARSVRR